MHWRSWCAVSLLATACIHVAPRPIDPQTSARAFEKRSLSDPAVQWFVAGYAHLTPPIARWNTETLTLAAFYFHPDLDVARARAAVARAATVTAAQRPDPTLSVPLEHKSEPHPWITVFDLDVTIETANKRGLRIREATDAVRSADFAVAQQAWQIRSAIRAQLAVLHSTAAAAAVLDRERQVQLDLIEALEKRVELGESSRVELAQARINGRQTELLRLDRRAQSVQARARLAGAIGIAESGLEGATFEFDPALTSVPGDIRERALLSRPDILGSLADYAAAESSLRLELARQYPDIHIAPGLGWDQGARRWDLGLTSLLPLLSRNRGPIAEAVARRSLSEAQFVALQGRVISALDEASALYAEAMRRLAETSTIAETQKTQFDAAKRLFEGGETDRVALRVAELELESANLAASEARAQAQAALGALEDAAEQPLTGSPLPPVPARIARGND